MILTYEDLAVLSTYNSVYVPTCQISSDPYWPILITIWSTQSTCVAWVKKNI